MEESRSAALADLSRIKGSNFHHGSKKRPLAAFQGELGAFSHSAARKLLGEGIAVSPLRHVQRCF